MDSYTLLFDATAAMSGHDPMVDVYQQLLGRRRWAGSDPPTSLCTSTVDVHLSPIDVYWMYDIMYYGSRYLVFLTADIYTVGSRYDGYGYGRATYSGYLCCW